MMADLDRMPTLQSAAVGGLAVRKAEPSDEAQWRRLWRGYCDFYSVVVPDHVTVATWQRILAREAPIGALVATDESGVVGFANYVVHAFTWSEQPACLLEDLFVDPDARGRGIGTLLIRSVRDLGVSCGWARLYWLTRAENDRARRVYERIVPVDGFVRYTLPLQPTNSVEACL